MLSAMYTGFTIGGTEGVRAAVIHTLLDGLSDRWKRDYGGARMRDAIEAVMNLNAY